MFFQSPVPRLPRLWRIPASLGNESSRAESWTMAERKNASISVRCINSAL